MKSARSTPRSADRAFHLELDQPVQLDCVLQWQFFVIGSKKPFTIIAYASAS